MKGIVIALFIVAAISGLLGMIENLSISKKTNNKIIYTKVGVVMMALCLSCVIISIILIII